MIHLKDQNFMTVAHHLNQINNLYRLHCWKGQTNYHHSFINMNVKALHNLTKHSGDVGYQISGH